MSDVVISINKFIEVGVTMVFKYTELNLKLLDRTFFQILNKVIFNLGIIDSLTCRTMFKVS